MSVTGLASSYVSVSALRPHSQSTSEGGAVPPQGAPTTPPTPGDTITVATFNCENVFLGPPDPGHDAHDQPPKPEAALAAVGRVLQNTRADVVAVQEVHDKKALDALVDKYMTGNPYPYRVIVPGNDSRGINVAILSKYPIVDVHSNVGETFDVNGRKQHFSRDFLEATVRVKDGFDFTIGTTHLKAQAGGQAADDKRLGEGKEIHKILTERMAAYPGRRYVVCGDFNDVESSPAVRAVKGHDGDAARLYDPLAGSSEISHPATHRRIDFLLLSDGMKDAYIEGSEHVVNDPDAAKGSDHLPVVAQFRV